MFFFQLSTFSLLFLVFFSMYVVSKCEFVSICYFYLIVWQRNSNFDATRIDLDNMQQKIWTRTTAILHYLKQLFMFIKRKHVKKDGSNTHYVIIENVTISYGAEHTNEKTNFINVSKKTFCDGYCTFNCMEWYYFAPLNVLSILFDDAFHSDSTPQHQWQKKYVRVRTNKTKAQKKCKDNANSTNPNNRNDSGALHFSSCALVFDISDTLLNVRA